MKKIFSLLAAVLFAGSMMAKEYTVTIGTADFPGNSYANNNGTHTSDAVAADNSTIEVEWSSNQVMFQNSKIQGQKNYGYIKNAESWGEIKSITINNNANFTYSIDTEDAGKFEIKAGSATSTASSIVIVFEQEESTTPTITAKDFDFGKVVIAADADYFNMDTSIIVTGANLTEAIEITQTENVDAYGMLTAEGGILHISILAEPGDFSDTIILTSGETVKEVVISGKVIKPVVLPGTPATMTANDATKAYEASVDGVAGVKVGTNSANGSFVVTVPANANVLHFYAAAWTGAAGTIAVSAPEGVTLDQTKLNLVADAGISGSSNDYLLQALAPAECRFDINLSGVTEDTEITFASGTARRFVVWGATYELGEETPVDPTPEIVAPYCATEVGHLFEENAAANSFVLLSIGSKDGKTIVRIDQDADKNNMLFDYLQVTNLATTGADITEGGEASLAVEFDTPVAVNDSITLEILWSTVDWDGRWMVQNVKVPATATCESAVMISDSTTGIINNSIDAKVYKTVINGQVVIVRDGKMINMLGVEL